MTDGTTTMLLPFRIISGSPTVGGVAVVVGKIIFLKQDVTVQPPFLGLAISEGMSS